MNKVIKSIIILMSGVCLSQTLALDLDDLTFVSGESSTNYTELGKPSSVYSISQTLPSDILTNIYSLLPQGGQVNPAFIANNRASSIAIDEDLHGFAHAEVSVTFLNEDAAYRNSLGYFIFETNNPPQSIDDVDEHQIIFPNTSKVDSGGQMVEGDTLDLNINVPAGHTISFFVIPNGWGWSGSYNNIASFGEWDRPFYTLSHLNPESTEGNRRHNVAFLDPANELLVLGFEDLLRPSWGDNDFNDLLFSVSVNPFKAISGVNEDGTSDGTYVGLVLDEEPEITTTTVFPAADIWGTLAYEDYWPQKGDYDFNDLVMKYRFTETLNSDDDLIRINAKFVTQAVGAGYHNGFALRLPNHDINNIESVTLTRNNTPVSHEILESGSNETVIVVSADTHEDVYLTGQLTNECLLYRVEKSCIHLQTIDIDYDLVINFKSPVSRSTIGQPPYDPFIFATPGLYHGDAFSHPGRGWETHLKEFTGTTLFDTSFLNTWDDASDGTNNFISTNGLPWAFNLTESWVHPLVGEDISDAYTKFPLWASSGGQQHADWYTIENATLSKIAQ